MFSFLSKKTGGTGVKRPLPKEWRKGPTWGFHTHLHRYMHSHRTFSGLQENSIWFLKTKHTNKKSNSFSLLVKTTNRKGIKNSWLTSGHCMNYNFCSPEFLPQDFYFYDRDKLLPYQALLGFEYVIYHICFLSHYRITQLAVNDVLECSRKGLFLLLERPRFTYFRLTSK